MRAKMHLLPVTTVSLDDCDGRSTSARSRRRRSSLSFTDSDLTALGGAQRPPRRRDAVAAPRLAEAACAIPSRSISTSRRPPSAARFVLCAASAASTIGATASSASRRPATKPARSLAVCPATTGPTRASRLLDRSPESRAELDAYFRAGGVENLQSLLRRLARHRPRRRRPVASPAAPRLRVGCGARPAQARRASPGARAGSCRRSPYRLPFRRSRRRHGRLRGLRPGAWRARRLRHDLAVPSSRDGGRDRTPARGDRARPSRCDRLARRPFRRATTRASFSTLPIVRCFRP